MGGGGRLKDEEMQTLRKRKIKFHNYFHTKQKDIRARKLIYKIFVQETPCLYFIGEGTLYTCMFYIADTLYVFYRGGHSVYMHVLYNRHSVCVL